MIRSRMTAVFILVMTAFQGTAAEDPPLQGVLAGKPWSAISARLSHLPATADVWYVDVYGEALPGKFDEPTGPFLIVPVPKKPSARKLGNSFNITLSAPPSDNEPLTKGSVVTTKVAADAVSFSVTVAEDSANHLVGKFTFTLP